MLDAALPRRDGSRDQHFESTAALASVLKSSNALRSSLNADRFEAVEILSVSIGSSLGQSCP